jgi:uncharacterized protein YndB with AHSA1/START domain
MTLDLNFEERFEQSIDSVWLALTDSVTLARWLMENDFEPRVGKRFTLRHTSSIWSGTIECEVIKLQPPNTMVWSWSSGDEPDGRPSVVTFELRRDGEGTVLTVRHVGSADDTMGKLVAERWPIKLAGLRSLLHQSRP